MEQIIHALKTCGLISADKADAEIKRRKRIGAMKRQLDTLYDHASLPNLIKIEKLEIALAMMRR